MRTRRSIRGFLNTPVPQALLDEILEVALRAPSGTNTQPWQVHVLTGRSKDTLTARLQAVFDDPERMGQREYKSVDWPQPYLGRRRKVGWDLYGLLDIGRGDSARMHSQHRRNLDFFGAPVGLLFTLKEFMSASSYLDVGMLMQNIMLAAAANGLDTCPQGMFIQFADEIVDQLGLATDDLVVCGMALGYRDHNAPENQLVTEREPLGEMVRRYD
ncbi:nitroreductase [Noviherbaspirillum sp. DKR-6]|uniref:Nitroreductase n=2 Tax=Noviherbaspirillum pedocola TaxID=2801341 RepID=A0A934SY55_9BURK|nr:nitroreductase [Noviherbaspirillum pedocola]